MKLGIALSGGGIRGIAHAGVLKALEENEIKPQIISGTSSGSIVATLYALGYSPYYIYILFKRYAKEICGLSGMPIISSISSFIVNKKVNISGINDGKKLEKAFNSLAGKKGIKKVSEIEMPLLIPTVDITKSKEFVCSSIKSRKYIGDIEVGKAVYASSAFPVVFKPCKYRNHIFVDGGVLNNIPVKILKENGADIVIAVNFDSDTVDNESNIMDIIMKTLDIMGNKVSDEQLDASDFKITIPSDGTGLLDVDNIDYCYNSGYKETLKHMEEIKNLTF
ncbi:MAG: patatin-like phospholipase family protein [Clostridia bacterium]|nr:patatin-like phospholipase family protein [Clostridia bacterium]